MRDSATGLQVRSELAEDVIGTYIGRLNAALAGAEAARTLASSSQQLAVILWLNTELRNAGLDRAKLFEYQADLGRLDALIELYEQKLFALADAERRAREKSAADDPTFLRRVLDAAARSQTA